MKQTGLLCGGVAFSDLYLEVFSFDEFDLANKDVHLL